MKKIILVLTIAALIFSGCAADNQDEDVKEETKWDPILICGIISGINEDMITVEVVEGSNDSVIVIKLSDETGWDISRDLMKENQYITAEISPVMTRSLPPQSNALRIVSLNDIILGEVTKITETAITLSPVNYYSDENVVINISEETKWAVERENVSVGNYIRVRVGMQMTASLPPQVAGVEVLSIETRD